jgi:hypothetical protein
MEQPGTGRKDARGLLSLNTKMNNVVPFCGKALPICNQVSFRILSLRRRGISNFSSHQKTPWRNNSSKKNTLYEKIEHHTSGNRIRFHPF